MDRCLDQSQHNAGTEPLHPAAGGWRAASCAKLQHSVLYVWVWVVVSADNLSGSLLVFTCCRPLEQFSWAGGGGGGGEVV